MTNKHLKNKSKSIQLNPIMVAIRDAINDKKIQGIALSALMVGGMAVIEHAIPFILVFLTSHCGRTFSPLCRESLVSLSTLKKRGD